ncbi:MAG: substrate-binding domain-containing protein, partial [Oscillospiraceae bacterium]|nr:substrate-binding domain-containing protein [Oscillospiraceae bacterium]
PCDSLRLTDGDDWELFRDFLRGHMADGKLDIDGIFCSTDLLAWRIQNMLKDLDVRVPEDVQIIGFD